MQTAKPAATVTVTQSQSIVTSRPITSSNPITSSVPVTSYQSKNVYEFEEQDNWDEREKQLRRVSLEVHRNTKTKNQKWDVDSIFPIQRSIVISADNQFNARLEECKKAQKYNGYGAGLI